MDTEDGQIFIKNLAYFVRTHEKALANALQLQRQGLKNGAAGSSNTTATIPPAHNTATPSTVSTFTAALSLPYLSFTSQTMKPAKLTLTPHHLFYLLSRFEELGVAVGPTNVRLENIHTDASPANYVSFLSQAQRNKRNSDRDSIHSVSSIRSVMTSMSSLWTGLGLSSNSAAKAEKQKAQIQEDLRYLYSAFTKIPCLRLAPDHKARLIAGYEEFPFDTAVPLFAFKNLSALEIYDVDFRQFFGWDRLADQLRSLTVKRAGVDDPADLLINIVLDDQDKRRRRSAKAPPSPILPWPPSSPVTKKAELAQSDSASNSPAATESCGSTDVSQGTFMVRASSGGSKEAPGHRQRSSSPARPPSSRHGSSYAHGRSGTPKIRRSSGSSNSSVRSTTPRGSASNLLSLGYFPASKWRFLRHLSLSDNGLTAISASSLTPLANTLQSLDLSSNLFTEIPDSLATLTSLRALNLSNCMIQSLRSLARNPLPAITTLNLRANRLTSLAGVERLFSLERLDLRENKLTDPTELARLTGVPEIQELFVNRNPFVKTHSNYRITIFNLFRTTPGYTEDIVIDSTGPSYSERKQLSDRVPELANVPVVRPPPEEDIPPRPSTPVAPVTSAEQEDLFAGQSRPKPSPAQRSRSEYGVSSQRRRKGPKRRIVELSQQESVSRSQSEAAIETPKQAGEAPFADSTYGGSPDATLTKTVPHTEQLVRSTKQDRPRAQKLLSGTGLASSPELSMNGDLYRKKIEALRNDFGNGWLSALGDGDWDSQQKPHSYRQQSFSPSAELQPPLSPARTPSQGIVSGGRVLG